MKSKKWIVAMLSVTVFSMMALGSGSSDSENKKEIVSSSDTSDGEKEEKKLDVTINEEVMYDKNDIKITALEYTTDSLWGDGIKIVIENNTDKDITISCDALIVNDYMIMDTFISDVAANKKAKETIYLSSSELKAAGIDSVGQVEIYFHGYESDSYDTVFDTEKTVIQTSEYSNMDTTPNDVGTELYNEGGIKIVGKTVDDKSFWGNSILLYIENTSGKNIGVSCDNMSINGYMISPFFSCNVYNDKKAIDSITILSSDLEENDIESIDEVELQFHIYNSNTYDTIADTKAITFSTK